MGYEDGSGPSSIVAREHEDELGLGAIVVMGGAPEGDITYGVTSDKNARYIAACSPEVVKALVAVAEAAGKWKFHEVQLDHQISMRSNIPKAMEAKAVLYSTIDDLEKVLK